jgi:myo-inositol-1(or 4)-monophosphatase
VTGRPGLDGSLIGTGFPLRYKSYLELYLQCFRAVFHANGAIRRDGCAALNLCYVACGRFDGFWEFLLWPWDLAAGSLIIEEAGGKITDPDGTKGYMASGNTVAGNPAVHEALARCFIPVLEGKKIERP